MGTLKATLFASQDRINIFEFFFRMEHLPKRKLRREETLFQKQLFLAFEVDTFFQHTVRISATRNMNQHTHQKNLTRAKYTFVISCLYTIKQLFTANKSLYKINSLSCHRLKKKYPIYDIQKELLKKCTILEITQ